MRDGDNPITRGVMTLIASVAKIGVPVRRPRAMSTRECVRMCDRAARTHESSSTPE